MSIDDTPPHVTALFDQQRATESLRESAALLITLEEVVRTFSSDLARKLSKLSMQGSDGLMEMVSIVQMLVDARNTRASEVKHFHHDDEPLS
ncbi:MAG TPA: hypothetical protein PLB92_00240 [Rhodoglobus sp.]|nr:hypothetical protein [Rhodoglobus sp.]